MSKGVIIRDGFAFLVDVLGGRLAKQGVKMPLQQFLEMIWGFRDPPKGFFPIPQGVKFYEWKGDAGVVVVELEPTCHSFRWIKDLEDSPGSPADIGANVAYERRTFALPYVVLILPFYKGILQTGACQVFYRTSPLSSWEDTLLMTNFLNVARGYGFTSWACMVQYQQEQGISWEAAVENAVRYFLWSAFNRSSEANEGNSHYGNIRSMHLDLRISSAKQWEQASLENPRFVLEIPWPETGLTLRKAVDLSFSRMMPQQFNPLNAIQGVQGGGNAQT